jgi:phosphate transport system permease protein
MGGGLRYARRRAANACGLGVAALLTAAVVAGLVWIIAGTVVRGAAALDLHVFTESTPAPGERGGLANALVGSLVMVAIAVAIGAPAGILAGTYLGEFGAETRAARVIRFFNDILLSTPSIVIGLFVYALVVVPMGRFSGLAGGVALAIIILPIVVRTTDEMLHLVPQELREAALALGAPQWVVVARVSYRAAASGILTGVLLGIARIAGETAPLLFTALNNQFWSTDLGRPMANVPVVIFQFAMSPYEDWQRLAWAAALVAIAAVLSLNLLSRAVLARRRTRP